MPRTREAPEPASGHARGASRLAAPRQL